MRQIVTRLSTWLRAGSKVLEPAAADPPAVAPPTAGVSSRPGVRRDAMFVLQFVGLTTLWLGSSALVLWLFTQGVWAAEVAACTALFLNTLCCLGIFQVFRGHRLAAARAAAEGERLEESYLPAVVGWGVLGALLLAAVVLLVTAALWNQ